MPAPIPRDTRRAIVNDIRRGYGVTSAGRIARRHGVSRATVTNIARENDLIDAFQRTRVARAAEAQQRDNRARRAIETAESLEESAHVRARLREPAEQLVWSEKLGEWRTILLDQPTAKDLRDLAHAYAALTKSHADLAKVDADETQLEHSRSLLDGLAERYGLA